MSKKGFVLGVILLWIRLNICFSLQLLGKQHNNHRRLREDPTATGRRKFLSISTLAILSGSFSFPTESIAKSYSSNARNLERMNSGDMSGGSVYDNNPQSDAGKRRRAMIGCKNTIAREEAAQIILKVDNLSEKDCNQMVLDGNAEFMLQTLRNLDCPSCPYGIQTTR